MGKRVSQKAAFCVFILLLFLLPGCRLGFFKDLEIKVELDDFVPKTPMIFYITNDKKIATANIDGSKAEIIIDVLEDDARALIVDRINGRLYWTLAGITIKKLQTSHIDGSKVEDVLSINMGESHGCALDTDTNTLYVTEFDNDRILRLPATTRLGDADSFELIGSGVVNDPTGVAVDTKNNALYWTEYNGGAGLLRRSDLDGNSRVNLIDVNIDFPIGIALDLEGDVLYWVDWNTKLLYKAPLIPPNFNAALYATGVTGLNNPYDVAVYPAENLVYWTAGLMGAKKVYRGFGDQLTGAASGFELTLLVPSDDPWGIIVDY